MKHTVATLGTFPPMSHNRYALLLLSLIACKPNIHGAMVAAAEKL